ncbi:MAG: TIGR02253 family HAD-type hydrolase [Candidatus Hodarchaeota archaeon]
MSSIKLVAFDLDDCLFDSTGLSERARIKGIDAMINLGLNVDRKKAIIMIQDIVKEYGSNSSQHYDYFIKRLNELDNMEISFNNQIKYIAGAVMAYHQEKIDSIKLYDDVKPCLNNLKTRGLKSAIITDSPLPIKQYEKILRLSIDKYIDLVIISDEIGIRKPNPKLFSYCLNKFKVKGSETIYIGDNLNNDIVPAKRNNIHSIYIHRGGKYDFNNTGEEIDDLNKPEFEIYDLNEIFEIIDQIHKNS